MAETLTAAGEPVWLEKAYWLFIALSLLLAFGLVLGITLKNGAPHGNDFYYHLQYAEKYARGQMAMFDPALTESNRGPYPPLFHLLLAIPALLGVVVQFGAFLNILFYPLAVAATAFLVYRTIGLKQAAFTAVLLVGAIAFFDRASQVTPQAFDAILAPVAAWAFFEKKELLFLAAIGIMVYSHAPYSFLILAPFVLYAFARKANKDFALKAMALSIPIALVILWFAPSYLSSAGMANNRQEQQIRDNPFILIQYIGAPLFFLFSITFLAGWWQKRKNRHNEPRPPTQAEESLSFLCLLWLGCLAPLLLFFPDRFASYAAQPMVIYAALFYARKNAGPKGTLADLALLFLLSIAYNLYWFYSLLLEGRLKPMPS